MRPDIPWNVAGIPPEAREAARVAARREGLSVGEWMTRRILRSFSDGADEAAPAREAWTGSGASAMTAAEEQPTRRDTEDMLAHVARSETESGEVFRRIEEQLRGVARRLEAAERSQTENNRAMSKAASEINIATREQAQAFDQLGSSVVGLADRVDRVERTSTNEGLKDAVKGLHQGLTRLADQISATANQSATQISALADNLESVAGRAGQTRNETEAATRAFEQRIAQIDERVRSVERLAQASQETMQRALTGLEPRKDEDATALRRTSETTTALARLEDKLVRLETRGADPAIDRRLFSIEHRLGEIASRFEASEASQRESVSEMRAAMGDSSRQIGSGQPEPHSVTGSGQPLMFAPPLAERAVPDNAPPFQGRVEPFAISAVPASALAVPEAAFDNAGIAHEPMTPPPTAPGALGDSFLFAARRSARAATAQAEVERGTRPGGFSWGTESGSIAAEATSHSKRTYLWIAIIALLAIAAIGAGAILSQRLTSTTFHPARTLFSRDTASAPSGSKPVEIPQPASGGVTSANPPEMKTFVVPVGPSGAATDSSAANTASTNPAAVQAAPTTSVVPSATSANPSTALPHTGSANVPPARSASAPANGVAPAHPTIAAGLSPVDKLTALANAGNAKAELVVGLKYLDGDGIAVNETDAAKWLARAANHGQAVAQYRLGTLFERGRGVGTDAAKAVHWYTLAAQAGNRKAMHNLAVAYASGAGTSKNLSEAARWFSKAAALGLSDSEFNLAVLYERGLGVPQSLLDAYKWYAIAAATGDAESKGRIDALATQLSADDRAAAQRSARAFHAQPLDVKANVAPLMSDVTG